MIRKVYINFNYVKDGVNEWRTTAFNSLYFR